MIDSIEHSFNTVNIATQVGWFSSMTLSQSDKIKQLVRRQGNFGQDWAGQGETHRCQLLLATRTMCEEVSPID